MQLSKMNFFLNIIFELIPFMSNSSAVYYSSSTKENESPSLLPETQTLEEAGGPDVGVVHGCECK